ncbi:hypothetical protein SK128_007818 [Halocaridina rubra]|uniref:Uncharacterized protein n=1 Tax=Halocaridina rubra TaxID=373956 RepID=A0AAN8WLL6_HALRR
MLSDLICDARNKDLVKVYMEFIVNLSCENFESFIISHKLIYFHSFYFQGRKFLLVHLVIKSHEDLTFYQANENSTYTGRSAVTGGRRHYVKLSLSYNAMLFDLESFP